jgi:large subunit ribosomal protein L2
LYKICLAGGTYFKILYKSFCGNFFVLKIPSGKQIKVLLNCFAVLGKNSNKNIKKEMVGLAGISFFRGKRPSVRGVAMNPVDHPNGGRTKTNKPEKSP